MYSCRPKISWTTSTTGKGPEPSGRARYAAIRRSPTGISTIPATSPDASVCTASARTGPAASAYPATTAPVRRSSRRVRPGPDSGEPGTQRSEGGAEQQHHVGEHGQAEARPALRRVLDVAARVERTPHDEDDAERGRPAGAHEVAEAEERRQEDHELLDRVVLDAEVALELGVPGRGGGRHAEAPPRPPALHRDREV